MNTRKTISIITASALLMGSVSGCSLFGKDKKLVTETLTSYIEAIQEAKYKNSKKYVVDEEDYFQENELDEVTAGILAAAWDLSTFEVAEVETDKESATAEVVFTLPDLESISGDDLTYEEFVDAIADIEDTVTESVDFELSKDGDAWLIEADSTEDFYNFLTDLTKDLEFAGLSNATAIAAVDQFIDYLAAGDLQSAIAMSSDSDGSDEILSDLGDSEEILTECLQSFWSRVEYVPEVTASDDSSITVTISGTAPDTDAALIQHFSNTDELAPIFADYFEGMINGDANYDYTSYMYSMYEIVTQAVNESDLGDYQGTFIVTADDDGNLFVDPQNDVMSEISIYDLDIDNDAIMTAALDLLLEQGRITQSDYNLYMGISDPGASASSAFNTSSVIDYEGDDYYSNFCYAYDDHVELGVVTWAYYDQGSTFEYEIVMNNSSTVSGTYVMPNDSEDHIYIDVPTDSPAGTYELTIYDEGSSSSVLAVITYIIVSNDGSVTPDQLPLTGPTGRTLDFSDDCYSFHFENEDGEYIYPDEGDEVEGEIRFVARTWAYYSNGEQMECAIFLDGELIGNLAVQSESGATDTFVFTYAPDDLESGDYAFVMFDVGADSVYSIAYVTVD